MMGDDMNPIRLNQRRTTAIAAWVGLLATGASAQDILVWSSGNSRGGNTPGVADYLMDTGHFASAVGINQDTPFSLNELLRYDGVLYFSNGNSGQDSVGIGNVLADYADAGGCVVIAVFSWSGQQTNTLRGRIIEDQLSPFVMEGQSAYSDVVMDDNDGSIFFENVETLSGHYHDRVKLTPDAILHGTWDDGYPLVGSKANVIGVNLFPDDIHGHIGGDYPDLFANALRGCDLGSTCKYVIRKSRPRRGCNACPAPGETYESASPCEVVRDCFKKLGTTTHCPDGGPGRCRLKGKRSEC